MRLIDADAIDFSEIKDPFDKARAESIETVDDVIDKDDEDLWNSVIEEYEAMEGNRDVY